MDSWLSLHLPHRAGPNSSEGAKELKELAGQEETDQKTCGCLQQGRPTFCPGLRHGARQGTVLDAAASKSEDGSDPDHSEGGSEQEVTEALQALVSDDASRVKPRYTARPRFVRLLQRGARLGKG